MKMKEHGNPKNPAIILLHGGGLSDWSLDHITVGLQDRYHVITPVIDGHGEDADTEFISIEDSAGKLIHWIDDNLNGHVLLIGGLSIGAQIVLEALSRRNDLAECAILESTLVYPVRGIRQTAKPVYDACYGLIHHRWFAKAQANSLCLPQEYFEYYYRDSMKMSKSSLINIALSNGTYQLKDTVSSIQAHTLIIAGDKGLQMMKKSARRLHELIPDSKLLIEPDMKHGELSLCHPDRYLELLNQLIMK